MELEVAETTGEIERGTGWLDVQLPLTRAGWDRLQSLSCGDDVEVVSADRDVFTGTVADIDEDRYQVSVELN